MSVRLERHLEENKLQNIYYKSFVNFQHSAHYMHLPLYTKMCYIYIYIYIYICPYHGEDYDTHVRREVAEEEKVRMDYAAV